ncbi:Ldh family oxidoreductase [Falsiroseomonas selenitidurans]|uniref:Ldh family oxidoreductase n=1 Tax=Falsiroseomonas selenitidurans TaxID=2716335 RepID=A0ABX1E112_9PROT|nr:Ldh family oxidoreductase [Falsiroseomonas selenitidurans]NKC29513.1 Ldh family oxidoreductase [Falsiroseomonas selenitidurans]
MPDPARHHPERLIAFAEALCRAAGLDAPKAAAVAKTLVESDLLGHVTHGLALLPRYLDDALSGGMTREGEPEVVRDRGACLTWNGRRLPGPWLVHKALDIALERVATYGTCSVAIGDSHHIGCLAAYLTRATDRGCMAVLSSSASAAAAVAPFGAISGVLAPDPVAAGIPTEGDPILMDVSASITTINMAGQLQKAGARYAHPWVQDAQGNPSTDPAVLTQGGTLLPAGGLDHGQKGYAWALLNEAQTQGLSGYGRADRPTGWTASVLLQVYDPEAFAGLDAFRRQTTHTAEACRAATPRPGVARVRLPGESGLAHRRAAFRDGLALSPAILGGLQGAAAKLGVALPEAMSPPG